jgi:hypothetical protein
MKKQIILFITLPLVLMGASAFILQSGGMIGYTGSPGEGTCANCHTGGTGSTVVNISSIPSFTSNQFAPGGTYTINVAVLNNAYDHFGFDCEILDPDDADAGTMSNPGTGVQLLAFGDRMNATHTMPNNNPGMANFSFVWVAPSTGSAVIYASGNAVNNNGDNDGDMPNNTSLALTASVNVVNAQSSFTAPSFPCLFIPQTMTNTSTGTPTPTYTWSTNPAATISNSNATNPTITFSVSGIYTITLLANNTGTTSSYSQTVQATYCNGIDEWSYAGFSELYVFPNPTSADFSMTYHLAMGGKVQVLIYDTQGKMVKKLLDEMQYRGEHQMMVSSSSLEKGVYHLSISVDGKVTANRMLIIQ